MRGGISMFVGSGFVKKSFAELSTNRFSIVSYITWKRGFSFLGSLESGVVPIPPWLFCIFLSSFERLFYRTEVDFKRPRDHFRHEEIWRISLNIGHCFNIYNFTDC